MTMEELVQSLSFVPTYPAIGYVLVAGWAIGVPFLLLAIFRSGGPSRSWLSTVLGLALASSIVGLTLQKGERNLFVWHVVGTSTAILGFQPAAIHTILSKHSFAKAEDRASRAFAHKMLQMAVVSCVGAGFAAIFLNKPPGFPGKHFMSAHSLIGLSAMALMAGNMVQAAYMQGNLFKPNLRWVSRVHRMLGTAACMVSFLAIMSGLFNRTIVLNWKISPLSFKFSLPSEWSTMGGWSMDTHGASRTWVFIGCTFMLLLLLLFPGQAPKPWKAKK